MLPLPVDAHVPLILDALRVHRAAVVTAPPGAGKTTRVPPAIAADGPVIVLQPRRIAARAIAQRIAAERGWTLGREVGWHVRFERRFGDDTQVLLATEGILTARLQQDPLLSGFRTIVLDEFHERSTHADLGIALAKQAWRARPDLRLLVMSATLAAEPVAAFLDGCPVISVPGRAFPIEIDYRPGQSVADAAAELVRGSTGSVLCFLPGAPEIHRAEPDVRRAVAGQADTVVLYGSLGAEEQAHAIGDGPRRVILATNVAETSLTVPGVTAVVDTGLVKVARYDPDRAIDALEVERVAADAAAQRAGRAGRIAPGRARRLWAETDRLRPHTEPEIHRVDLSEPVLEVLGWGADPATFEWFDPPDAGRLRAALDLLDRLGAVRAGTLTPIGRRMAGMPLHPRLARMLIDADGSRDVALACAVLSERAARARPVTTSSDLLTIVQDGRALPRHVIEVARRLMSRDETLDGDQFRHAVFCGYPDRVAKRRAPGSPRFLLASGHGAVLGPESGVHDAEFIVAIDVHAGRRGEGAEARIRMASEVDAEWLEPTDIRIDHFVSGGGVRAIERTLYDAIVLSEAPSAVDSAAAEPLLAEAYVARGWTPEDEQLIRRMRFAGLALDPEAVLRAAVRGRARIQDVRFEDGLDHAGRLDLAKRAPATLRVPSGRDVALNYDEHGLVTAAVKLQELFGLADSPRIGPRQEPVVFLLLAPNGRPVQTTRDLRNFWNTTYHDVRRELRGRYPKHPWPDDPWTATPTARTRRRAP